MEPLSVARIIDRSIKIAPKMFVRLLPVSIPLALISALAYTSPIGSITHPNYFILLPMGIVGFVAFIWYAHVAASLWKDNADISLMNIIGLTRVRTCLRLLSVSLMVGLGAMGIIAIAAIPSVFLMPIVEGNMLLGMITIIPIALGALTWLCTFSMNRILATWIVIFEDKIGSAALSASKSLMTRSPQMKRGSPFMRLSAISLFLMIIAIVVGGVTQFLVYVLSAESGLVVFSIMFFQIMISYFTTCVSSAAYVGFYYDLRARYDAQDILSDIQKIGQETGTLG